MGVGTILLIVFVVLPAVQWSLWGGRSKRHWSRKWGGIDGGLPGVAEEVASLRSDLEGRLNEVEHWLGERTKTATLNENRLSVKYFGRYHIFTIRRKHCRFG